VAAFIDYWEHTNSAKESFDRSQGKGCGLLGKRYQSSASFVLPFMNDFSPIIQIVKDLGAPYGGLAVGTLSLLFAVSVILVDSHRLIISADTANRWQATKMKWRKA